MVSVDTQNARLPILVHVSSTAKHGLTEDNVCCVVPFQLIDFYRFEETFRIDHQQHRSKTVDGDDIVNGGGDGETPGTLRRGSRRFEAVSLLENNRMRNVGQ